MAEHDGRVDAVELRGTSASAPVRPQRGRAGYLDGAAPVDGRKGLEKDKISGLLT